MGRGGLAFPLVPRARLLGVAFGSAHSARRGLGSDVAGSRPYLPGDDMGAIDWHASARLSSARDADEFVVRERFADEAPRVVALCDRRPAMALCGPGLPWLRKDEALRVALDLVATSAYRARGLFGYLDVPASGEPFWAPPTSEPQWLRLAEEIEARPFAGGRRCLEDGLDFLRLARAALPAGSFVFVLSDFLEPPAAEAWLPALEHGWDVVPVVIQDPTWEQSFPDVAGVAVPVVDADDGRRALVRVGRSRSAALRAAHEARLGRVLDELAGLGLEPVLVSSAGEQEVLAGFLEWADRRALLGHARRLGA